MKNIFFFIFISLVFFSCEKENELDGIVLGENLYDENKLPPVEIKSATIINCTVLALDLEIYFDRFPDTLEYSHYRIVQPVGDAILTKKTETIYVNALCNQLNEYTVQLYNDKPERVSTSSTFIFNEW